MGFNYAKEKAKFEKMWQAIRQQYEKAGMDAEAIDAMHDFDWAWFKSERKYTNHLSDMPDGMDLENFPQSTTGYTMSIYAAYGARGTSKINRYQWLDEIDSEELLKKLIQLGKADIELLTRLVFEEQLQCEIAQEQALSQAAVSKHLHKIKKVLKTGYKNPSPDA